MSAEAKDPSTSAPMPNPMTKTPDEKPTLSPNQASVFVVHTV